MASRFVCGSDLYETLYLHSNRRRRLTHGWVHKSGHEKSPFSIGKYSCAPHHQNNGTAQDHVGPSLNINKAPCVEKSSSTSRTERRQLMKPDRVFTGLMLSRCLHCGNQVDVVPDEGDRDRDHDRAEHRDDEHRYPEDRHRFFAPALPPVAVLDEHEVVQHQAPENDASEKGDRHDEE